MERSLTQEVFVIVSDSISKGLQNNNVNAQKEWDIFTKLLAAAEVSNIDKNADVQKEAQELTSRFIEIAPEVALAV